jgi:DNA repair exonuclease SbcCD nuclease subunit
MAKWALVTDTHFGARGDAQTILDAQRKFFEKVFFPTIDALSIQTVFHLGDLVDRRKYINISTLTQCREFFFKPLRERWNTRRLHTYFIPGNHDAYFRESFDVTAVKQLIPKHPAFSVVETPQIVSRDNKDVLLVPWICPATRQQSFDLINARQADTVFGHFELRGFDMYRGLTQTEGLDPSVFSLYNLVCSGHYHHISRQENIQYLGAPYEMTWADYKDPRGFWIFDTDTQALEFVDNPHRVFYRFVYDDEGKEQQYLASFLAHVQASATSLTNSFVKIIVKTKTQPYWFDLVLEALNKTAPFDLSVIDDALIGTTIDGELETLNAPVIDTLQLIDQHISHVTQDAAFLQSLQTVMRDLYKQAVEVHSHTNN